CECPCDTPWKAPRDRRIAFRLDAGLATIDLEALDMGHRHRIGGHPLDTLAEIRSESLLGAVAGDLRGAVDAVVRLRVSVGNRGGRVVFTSGVARVDTSICRGRAGRERCLPGLGR